MWWCGLFSILNGVTVKDCITFNPLLHITPVLLSHFEHVCMSRQDVLGHVSIPVEVSKHCLLQKFGEFGLLFSGYAEVTWNFLYCAML